MKKILALLFTIFSAVALSSCAKPEAVKIKNIPLTDEPYAFAIAKENVELKTMVDEYIMQITENGELENIVNSFFNGTATFEYSNPKSKNGCFVVATNAMFPPFEYYKGNKFTGIDIELAYNIANLLGKTLYIEDVDFTAVIPSVQAGHCEIGMAGLTVNAERLENVNFSVSYYRSSQVIVVKESNTEFDTCTTAKEVENILKQKKASYKIGAQNGTTGLMYARGDSGFGYKGFANISTIGFTSGALAIKDLSNGKIDAVIIDLQPAISICKIINGTIKENDIN